MVTPQQAAARNLDGLRIKDRLLREALEGEAFLVFDGAMGTQVQARGLDVPGEPPELLCITHSDEVTAIHEAYVAAGADVVTANTFGASTPKLEGKATVADVFNAAQLCARASGARYVAADIGPLGKLLAPLGDMTFDEAYDLFAEQMRAVDEAGFDLVLIETMADIREAKAALLAARDHTSLPVLATMTFGEDGRTFLGTPPDVAAEVLSSLGAQAVGVNCSLGPDRLLDAVRAMGERSRVPLLVQPNAGMPRVEDGRTVYDLGPEGFAKAMEPILDVGAGLVGSCCGSSPAFTAALRRLVDARKRPSPRAYVPAFAIASAQDLLVLPNAAADVAVIGERINPTGKPRLQKALEAGDFDYLVGIGSAQQQDGADALDVNVGFPGIDEACVMKAAVEELQATLSCPLVIDSGDIHAVEAACRIYGGKALVNSVNAKRESLDSVLPVVKRYGCAVIGLTLDEEGIPPTAEGRFAAAARIVDAAEASGIPRHDVVIDCLVMSAATNQDEVQEIIRAVKLVRERLGVHVALGVSNVSFGLPARPLVNATFLAAALGAGLDLPIINPSQPRYRDVIASYRVLNGQDTRAEKFVGAYASFEDGQAATTRPASSQIGEGYLPIPVPEPLASSGGLVREALSLILAGRPQPMPGVVRGLLEDRPPIAVVEEIFVPALDAVGDAFDRGDYFLPQLMASAEAVKAGFDVVRGAMSASGAEAADSGSPIVVATVRGDIHDIGKNIVRMLLENYGYEVIDLGKDVEAQEILDAVRDSGARLVGLSALMTTTLPAMEEAIALIHKEAPGVSVIAGGAVLTPEHAKRIGADFYAKDAAETARIASRLL